MTEEFKTGTATPPPPSSPDDDIEQAKGTAWLSYLGILWLIPMLTLKDSPFAKFHVKQGIVLTLGWLAVGVLSPIWMLIPFLGWLLGLVAIVALGIFSI